MTVVLKETHRNDDFITALNAQLTNIYGANTGNKFNSWQYLQEEADYINHDPEGKKQLPDWERPITKEALHRNFFWLRMGEFSFKLSGGGTADEARDAVAVCKWLMQTKCKFIDKLCSENYTAKTVKEYLNYLFEEDGYNLTELWKMPDGSTKFTNLKQRNDENANTQTVQL
ncbi:hypothetical protein [Mucilaginibacter ginsenosidivorax]|uniref:Uncharacterized protein n=1 Tax=Mucilaginibacter ginsenosidivorax TaxID=862126 RepID=A0A5B8VTG8_9SPHI|nr:hypothetical protein [Mucilaginibacter ginsenosidivorax]QEC74730.1 hypothetical protein FSB76_01735 [Mucilaginibacter ginsenosidivorax]